MALDTKLLLCFAFFLGGVCCRDLRQSYGTGAAVQTCPSGYYCQNDRQCKSPRSNRCTSSQNCPGLVGCDEQHDGSYLIRIGHSPLNSSLSSSSKQYRFEHQFVVYRGYTYEFGSNYLQVLDISDPNYRYVGDKDVTSYTTDGTSYCTYNAAVMFVNDWNRRYSVLRRNCQHFARGFSKYLQTASCNQQGSQALKQLNTNDTEILMKEIDEILSNCTIVCCDDNSSGQSALMTSVPLVAFTFIYTFFAVLM